MVMKKQQQQQQQLMVKDQKPTATAGESGGTRYKGVRKRKWGKYVSEIRLPNCRERIWLGSFDSAEKAARAFDAAMFCLRGPTANFNFPHDPPTIAGAHSLSRSQIQQAAAKFANDQPTPSPSPSPSPSVSVVSELELELEQGDFISDLDAMLTTMGSGNYAADFVFFPGFDDLSGEFYSPALTSPDVEFVGEEVLGQESFLWNF